MYEDTSLPDVAIFLVGGKTITKFINEKLLSNFYNPSSGYVMPYRTVMDGLESDQIVSEDGKPYRLDVTSAYALHNPHCDLMHVKHHNGYSYRQQQRRIKSGQDPVDWFLGTPYSCQSSLST